MNAEWLVAGSGPSFRHVTGYLNVVCLNRSAALWPEPCFVATRHPEIVLPLLDPGKVRGIILGREVARAYRGGISGILEDWPGVPLIALPEFILDRDWSVQDGLPRDAWVWEGRLVSRGFCADVAAHYLGMMGVGAFDSVGIDGGIGMHEEFHARYRAWMGGDYDYGIRALQELCAYYGIEWRRI